MLRAQELSVTYGGLQALQDISIEVQAGEWVTVLGANGAGKTTLLKSIVGAVPLRHGRIFYKDRDLAYVPGYYRATLGLAYVPEGGKVFPTLSVMENLVLGSYRPLAKSQRQASLQLVFTLFPVLYARRRQAAGTLSRDEQHLLALGRGLMLSPDLLLLDEPSLGLSPRLAENIFDSLAQVSRSQPLTILLAEQCVVEAVELCDHGYVLEAGQVVLAGSREELLGEVRVRQAYWEQ